MSNKLIISDLQFPFAHPDDLAFCIAVKEKFSVLDNDVYNVGDEVDVAAINDYELNPNGLSARDELLKARADVRDWAVAFPKMKICHSNHPASIYKLAAKAGIPGAMMKSLGEIYEAPPGWKWKTGWKVDNCIIEHGHDFEV